MSKKRKRDELINRLRKKGSTYPELAKAFGLSKSRVAKIAESLDAEETRSETGKQLLKEIKAKNDIDAYWNAKDLVNALGLTTAPRGRLLRMLLDQSNTGQATLRQLMESVISDGQDRRPGYLICPLLDWKNFGIKYFWEIVIRLTEVDLGKAFAFEWFKRLQRLWCSSRLTGERSSSSLPLKHIVTAQPASPETV